MSKVSGIYLITCRPEGGLPYYYVGQSINIERRKNFHLQRLRTGKHHNKFVQRCFDKHGEEAFSFEVLETCSELEIDSYESWWLSEMVGFSRCMNLSRDATAPFRGKKLSMEHRIAISIGGKGKKRGERTRRLISQANAGEKNSMFGKSGSMNQRSVPVIGRSLADGSLVRFESATMAEKHGFDQGSISKCCQGRLRSHRGYQWAFDVGGEAEFGEYAEPTVQTGETSNGGRYRSRAVIGTSLETGEIVRFESMSDAERNGFKLKSISAVCTGVNKTHKGYYWRYDE